MTVTLDINEETEAVARAHAEARGLSLEEYLQGLLADAVLQAKAPADRTAFVRALKGKFAFLGPSRLAEEKAEEIAREERRWTSK